MATKIDLQYIKNLINPDFFPGDQGVLVDSCSAAGEKAELLFQITRKEQKEYLLVRFDKDDVDIYPYFNDIAGYKKVSDYVLIVQNQENLLFFIIELKRGDAKVGPQLRATKLFVEFIINSIIRVNDGLSTNFFIGTIGVSLAKIEREREAKNMRKLKLRVTPCQFDNDNHMNYTKSKSFILSSVIEAAEYKMFND